MSSSLVLVCAWLYRIYELLCMYTYILYAYEWIRVYRYVRTLPLYVPNVVNGGA